MLKEWRTQSKLTQPQAAKLLGLHMRTYTRWEWHGIPPGLREVVRLAVSASNPACATGLDSPPHD